MVAVTCEEGPLPGKGLVPEGALTRKLGGNGKQRGGHCRGEHKETLTEVPVFTKYLFTVCSITDQSNSVALRTKERIVLSNTETLSSAG